MAKIFKSLSTKLVLSLFISLGILMGLFTWYQFGQIRTRVEQDLETKGFALAKSAAQGLSALIKNDLKNRVVTEDQLFDRSYKLLSDNPDPKQRQFTSAFDKYTDEYWQEYFDSFIVDNEVVFVIPAAFSSDPGLNGYVPTHNTIFKSRTKRIFNDQTGAQAAATVQPLKQVYQRDTGEVMWDMSHPVYVNGNHWGGVRVAISIAAAEAKIAALQKQTLIIMLVILIAISSVILIVSKLLVGKPLNTILEAVKNLASHEADFTRRLEVKSEDELGILAQKFNLFIEKIHGVVGKVVYSVDSVAVTSEQLRENAESVAQATQTVAQSIEVMVTGIDTKFETVEQTRNLIDQFTDAINQISKGAQKQAEDVNDTSRIIAEMDSVINNVASNAQTVLIAAADASEAAQQGESAVHDTVTGMEKIKTTVFETAQKIKELGEHSETIGEIIQVIDDIAEQTNLLALNAAIEAARAGEHGKGFSVVADEVRKLAERSSKATKEISVLIGNIRKGTENAVRAMELGTTEVEEGVRLAYGAGDALGKIMENVRSTLDRVKSISEGAQNMKESSSMVVAAINNVAAITEENSASTEQMAAGSDNAIVAMDKISQLTKTTSEHSENISVSVEEMAASTEDVAEAAEALERMATDLRDLTKGFIV